MAVDVCSEISSLGASPRISFSHDLNQTDTNPVEHYDHRRSDAFLLDSNSDFDFCIGKIFPQEFPSADELFLNGKILPIQVKKVATTKEVHQSENANNHTEKKRLKEYLSNSFDAEEEEEKPLSKSFWQFRRSSSLNCESGKRKGFIHSLQFLSRSYSTGSAPNPKLKQQSQKQPPPSIASAKPPAVSNYTAFYSYNSSGKTPLRKNCRSNGNGVRISPVLNIPHAYITKGTVSLFGLGSLFCNGKTKKKKK